MERGTLILEGSGGPLRCTPHSHPAQIQRANERCNRGILNEMDAQWMVNRGWEHPGALQKMKGGT